MRNTDDVHVVHTRLGNDLQLLVVQGRREGGGRAPLVLLHPINLRKESWLEVVALLSDRTCILVDLAGHGESSDAAEYSLDGWISDCVDLLDHLALPRVHVAGGSLGGAIALGVAVARPQSVLSVAGFGSSVEPAPSGARPPAPADPAALEDLFSALAREAVAPTADESTVDRVRALTNTHSPETVTRVLRAAYDADARALLGRVACPALWVAGEFDGTFTPAENTAIARRLRGLGVTFDGIGHLPMLEDPARVVEVLNPHLRSADRLTPRATIPAERGSFDDRGPHRRGG